MLKQQEIQSIKTTNSVQSAVLIAILAGILAYTGYALIGLNLTLITMAALAIFYFIGPRPGSGKMLMRMFRGQPLAYHHASRIHDIVNELARRAGLKETPKLYYLPQKQVNAFAFGHSREAGIALSQGLLNHLTLDEVSGVLAHEMSHIKHKDLSVMTLATTISNMTRMMANVGFFLLLINLPRVLLGMFPISWSAIFLLIFAPALAGMVQLALSRVREFRADLGAAQLLGTPQPLVSALTKMDRLNRGMFGLFAPSMRMSAPSLFSTHPPTPERIRRLRSVADQPAFEAPIRIVIPEVSHPQAVWM